jgi:hypothetical protein
MISVWISAYRQTLQDSPDASKVGLAQSAVLMMGCGTEQDAFRRHVKSVNVRRSCLAWAA